MSSKKQRNNPKSANPAPNELAHQAQQFLVAERFRDAVERFKALIKIQPQPDYYTGLAAAYAGRAKELLAKGMVKEALAIWDNRQQFCPKAPLDPGHINILLQAGRIADALNMVSQNSAQFTPDYLANLQVQLAALYLAGKVSVANGLAQDSPLITHGQYARAALEAYCRGDDAAVTTAIAAIPFRSPYRDWVQIVRALLKLSTDINGANSLLQRVTTDSPFAPLARAVGLALLPESAIDKALSTVTANTRKFAAALRGWSTTRLNLWREIKSLGDYPTALALEQFMHKHMQLLGKDWTQRQGLFLLVEKYPVSLKRTLLFRQEELTPLQRNLVAAWHADKYRDVSETLAAWNSVIDLLHSPTPPVAGTDNAVRIAVIQRTLEKNLKLLDQSEDAYQYFDDKRVNLAEEGCNLLEKSLIFDPSSIETYVRLIAYYRTNNRLKDARRLLTTALELWPDEPIVLGEAMDTSIRSEAFKKATIYARRLLELDPINRRARNSLLDAHLAHARKQIFAKSFALAEKELALAEEWAKDDQARLRLNIRRGFLSLIQNKALGLAALKNLLQPPFDNLSARLLLYLDAFAINVPLIDLMKVFVLPKTVNASDFTVFLGLLQDAFNKHPKTFPQAILDYFNPAFKQAKDLDLSLEIRELFCELLRRCNLSQLRLLHAEAALERWPGLPIFELHTFEAKYHINTKSITDRDIQRLHNAAKQSRQTGDMRTARRIEEIIIQFDGNIRGIFFNPFADGINELREYLEEHSLEDLFDTLDENPDLLPNLKEMEDDMGRRRLRAILKLLS